MTRSVITYFVCVLAVACGGHTNADASEFGKANHPAQLNASVTKFANPTMNVVAMEPDPVLSHGAAGTWDSQDVLNPVVVRFQGKLINYYSGWDGTVWRTGYATSTDNGLTWTRRASPVLGLGQWTTKYIAANGSAIVINNRVYQYFQGETPDGHQQIGLATSSDGIHFTMLPKPVVPVGPTGSYDDLHASDPYVIKVGKQYWMYYSASPHDYVHYTIARAVSNDGTHWTKDPTPLFGRGAPGSFDDVGDAEPDVFYQAPYYYMVFTANKDMKRSLGWASSTDGIHWTKQGSLVPDSIIPAWASQLMCDPAVIPTGNNDGTYYVFFGASGISSDAQNVQGQIGRLTVKVSY